MIKYLCDACDAEIPTTANRTVWTREFKKSNGTKVTVKVDALVTVQGTTNGGHICQACVVRTLVDGTPVKKGAK